jgi:hypothetical protein
MQCLPAIDVISHLAFPFEPVGAAFVRADDIAAIPAYRDFACATRTAHASIPFLAALSVKSALTRSRPIKHKENI